MSLLSRDRYVAVLGASGVGLGQRQGSETRWLGSIGFIDEGFHAWAVALETLDRLLGEHARAGAELSVVVSGHFSRFCLVPWSDQISSPDELLGFAQLCFEDLYGAPTQAWSLVLSAEPAGYDRIASALPQDLLERLRSLVSARGLRLRSVQPYLMAAFNHFDKSFDAGDFLFVVAEPVRSVLLLAREGRWTSVRSVGSNDSDAALTALIGREGQLQASSSERPLNVYLHAPARIDSQPDVPGVHLRTLEEDRTSVRDCLYVMSRAVA
ncbi:hypothetical protein [Pseudomonas nunensis]|uniref:Uncharacterized protein n=1 Tax=Pseudomonas nunensis TaxID=2961896 RepID=A0ABY5EKA8_9PSED|nr:hypothetical protein [Pseudomonas nunensis]KOX98748.1 hypothetical protein AM274_29270 [Pseudomonas nunensis]KPN89932.1 hypothetical protein AL066_06175 [Pseudomonas nunensis]MCL5228904.1 hypothetical protein [Pseudomonas nunensis]UTO16161.1 hypothetical protein NK667_07390 [Pseudomonas nunensis]